MIIVSYTNDVKAVFDDNCKRNLLVTAWSTQTKLLLNGSPFENSGIPFELFAGAWSTGASCGVENS